MQNWLCLKLYAASHKFSAGSHKLNEGIQIPDEMDHGWNPQSGSRDYSFMFPLPQASICIPPDLEMVGDEIDLQGLNLYVSQLYYGELRAHGELRSPHCMMAAVRRCCILVQN